LLVFFVKFLSVGLQALRATDLILEFVKTYSQAKFLEGLAKGPVKKPENHDVKILKTANVGKASLEIENRAMLQFPLLRHL
jgi:hypothetical protein